MHTIKKRKSNQMKEKCLGPRCLLAIALCFVHITIKNCGTQASLSEIHTFVTRTSNFVKPESDQCNRTSKSNLLERATMKTLFSAEQLSAFERDGFLVVSGLIDDQLEDFVEAGNSFVSTSRKLKAYFSSLEMGMIFDGGKSNDPHVTKAFRSMAFDSILPQAAAELMRLPPSQNVRVLRDVFMSKSVDEDAVCDWHVDDQGFWPESFVSENDGVNAWIAMEDMPAQYQGSMALSPGSHHADEWRYDAYEGIGQNHSFHGGFTKDEMKQRADSGKKLFTTCEIRHQAPEVREKIEKTKFIPDIKKGDVIFATRLLFHRTTTVTEEGKRYYKSNGIDYLNRYSIRYVPGTATLPIGWNFEWSIVTNSQNEGRSLDLAMENDSHIWYPLAWPRTEVDLDKKLDVIGDGLLGTAKAKARSEFFSLIALFSNNMKA